ncbi:MAG TPA: DUF177 domain-containing protein [Polyangiaceae bacterium]
MSHPELLVPVADLERGPKHITFELSEPWLRRALEGTDATTTGPGELEVTLSKNGGEILVRGQVKADLTMRCVITLDPVPVPVQTEILLMLSPRSGTGSQEDDGSNSRRHGIGKRRAKTKPRPEGEADAPAARPERPSRTKTGAKGDGHWEDTPILTDEDAGRDTYEGHEIALDSLVREFLLLELPMFPRRSDLPTDGSGANPPLPAETQPGGDSPLDPRLSPLAELKRRLENSKKE